MSIHSRIQDGRKKLGMSAQQFADVVGVSRGAVQQWEKEGGTAPRRAHQRKVASLLGLSVAQLMSQDEYLPSQASVNSTVNDQGLTYLSSISSILTQLAAHLSRMDADAQQLASGLLRDLALKPSIHATVAAALQAIAGQPNRKAA